MLANVLVFAFFAHCLCGVTHNPEQIKSSTLQHRTTFPVSSFGQRPAYLNKSGGLNVICSGKTSEVLSGQSAFFSLLNLKLDMFHKHVKR